MKLADAILESARRMASHPKADKIYIVMEHLAAVTLAHWDADVIDIPWIVDFGDLSEAREILTFVAEILDGQSQPGSVHSVIESNGVITLRMSRP